MKRIIKEERKRLFKAKLFKQGENQWRIVPVQKKDGSQVRHGDITFRGSEDKLKLLLRRLKAKDNASDPPSSKGKTYQQMIDSAKDKSDPYIWIWSYMWKMYKNNNKITIAENYNISDIDIYIQRNKDRMDKDTLIGVMADKFNISKEKAEEIIMKKVKNENKKNQEKKKYDPKPFSKYLDLETLDEYIEVLGFFVNKSVKELEKRRDIAQEEKRRVYDRYKKANPDFPYPPKGPHSAEVGKLQQVMKDLELKEEFVIYALMMKTSKETSDEDIREYAEGLYNRFEDKRKQERYKKNEGAFMDLDLEFSDVEFEDDMDYDEPDEEDAFITSDGNLLSVSVGSEHLGTFVEYDEAEEALRNWMNKNKYYPTIWFIDDHGGVEPYIMEENMKKNNDKKIEKKIVTIEEDVRIPNTDIILTEGDRIRITKNSDEG